MRLSLILLCATMLMAAACRDDPGVYLAGPAQAGGETHDNTSAQEAQAANGSRQENRQAATPYCSGRQSHPVALTSSTEKDRITIEVEREDCPEAAALVTIRAADGTLLIAEAFPLKALALTQAPSRENLHDLLSSFTENVTRRPAGELAPVDQATAERADNPSPIHLQASRELYERARQRGGNVICFPIHYENFQCVWHDAERGASYVLYYSGP